jgi:hypothetical protein
MLDERRQISVLLTLADIYQMWRFLAIAYHRTGSKERFLILQSLFDVFALLKDSIIWQCLPLEAQTQALRDKLFNSIGQGGFFDVS